MASQGDESLCNNVTEDAPLINGKSNNVLYSIQFRNGDTLNTYDKDARLTTHSLVQNGKNLARSFASISNDESNSNDYQTSIKYPNLTTQSNSFQNTQSNLANISMESDSLAKYTQIEDNHIKIHQNHAFNTRNPHIAHVPLSHNNYNTTNSNHSINSTRISHNTQKDINNKPQIADESHNNQNNTNHNNDSTTNSNARTRNNRNSAQRQENDGSGFGNFLEKMFKIKQRGSTISTEIRAGIVSFLTMAYIILINPKVLTISGLPYDYAAASTCLSSCIATLIAGIFGNLPVGCAPGVGLSAYFSYGMMASIRGNDDTIDEPWKNGMFVAFLSGALVFVLTLCKVTPFIIHHLPEFIKVATIVGMGTFLAFIGLVDLDMIKANSSSSNSGSILTLGSMDWIIWLAMANGLLIATLKYYEIKGSLLIGIVLTAVIYLGITNSWPTEFLQIPRICDPFGILTAYHTPLHTIISGGISFILILILDVSGCTFGIGKIAGLLKNGSIAGGHWALIATSVGTMIAALTGCSPMIVAIESSAGAAAGGKTGLTACVIAFLFGISTFFGPILGDVPPAATSPVLVLIGVLMMGQVSQIQWDNIRIALPAYMTIIMMPFTYSISNGLFFGLGSFFILYLLSGELFYKIGWLSHSNDKIHTNTNSPIRITSTSNSIAMTPLSISHVSESINMAVPPYDNLMQHYTQDYTNQNNSNERKEHSSNGVKNKQIFNAQQSRIDNIDFDARDGSGSLP